MEIKEINLKKTSNADIIAGLIQGAIETPSKKEKKELQKIIENSISNCDFLIAKNSLELKSDEQKSGGGNGVDMMQKSVNPKASLFNNFTIAGTKTYTFDDIWNPVWAKLKRSATIIM